jgi:hypothetical protein
LKRLLMTSFVGSFEVGCERYRMSKRVYKGSKQSKKV